MPKSTFSIFFFLFFYYGFSQETTVSGTLSDEDQKPVHNAVVALLTPKDSILYKFTRSDKEGKFEFKNVKNQPLILMTSHYQYADYVDDVTIEGDLKSLGTLKLISKSKLLKEVIIKTGSIRIKGDTTSYRASDFKVDANANVEELLKKLPGIQVDKNGEIKAMGETVKKVLVDGEEFFGDDPGMATKNLRADAVKEVQVFNKKSDQAEFTGIDDGNTEKTINLKLKEDKKKGFFGKMDAASGPSTELDSRYNTNLMLSSFKGKRKISGYLLNGNTGQDGLDWEDSEQFGGGNDNFSMNMDDDGNVNYEWVGGDNDEEPYVDTQNGFIKNTNLGLQYTNKWNDKQSLNVSPKFNNQIYTNTKRRTNKTQIGDSQLNQNENSVSDIKRNNFKLNIVDEIKIDSMNTIKIGTKTNFYTTDSDDFSDGITTDENGVLKNKSQVNKNSNFDKQALSATVLFKHKFKKMRRTFSANLSWNRLNNDSNSILISDNESYTGGILSDVININQNKIGKRTTFNNSLNLAYTEPLSKKIALQVGYEINYNIGKNKLTTYDFSSLNNQYDIIVSDLSNQFKQTISVHKPNLKISYNSKKINFSFGSGLGITTFDLLDQTANKKYDRNFTNIFPSANFSYKYKSNSSLSIRYNGSTRQPTIDQLQPLTNNQDFFNQRLGNPDLKQSFNNSISFSQNTYNMLTETYFYQSINFRTTSNLIIYNRDINLEDAKTILKPINTSGNFSINFYSGCGFKIKKIDLNLNISPSLNYSKYPVSINSKLDYSKNLNSGFSIYLSKEKEKKYSFSINNQFSYTRNNTTLNDEVRSFNTNNLGCDIGVFFSKNWKISTDYTLFTRQKTDDFQTNLTNQFWNARLQRVFKNDEFTAYFLVRDILNQNIGIDRFNSQNTIGEEQNDRLKRYFMLGLSWNFKNKNETKP